MKTVFSIIMMFALAFAAYGQGKKAKKVAGYTFTNYEVECLGTGTQGSQLMMIYGYGKTPDAGIIQAKMNAVHAVIFKGITAGSGCMRKPLASSPRVEQDHQEYFKGFFDPGGMYLNYVALSGEGVRDAVKINRKTYKVGIVVSVMHAALRKQLEEDGIIKPLTSGF